MIGHASSDERGKYSGGQAGDQTSKEVCIRSWYDRPWNVVMWSPDPDVRENMAISMEEACKNDHIGYDQGTSGNSNDRYSLYNALLLNNFKMAEIDKPVETDCSNLVACCACCAGVEISPYIYTGNEKSAFVKAGFEVHTEAKYLTSDDYLPRGAILLYEGNHTAINLTDGAKVLKINGWSKSDGVWYFYRNNKKLKREWLLWNHKWYRFGINGEMLIGYHLIEDNGEPRPCLFGEDGALYHEAPDHRGFLEPWYVE